MSQDLHHAGENVFFFSNIISMSEYYDFPCFDITYLTNDKIKHYVGLIGLITVFRRHLDGKAKRSEITVFVWESDSE